jgi:NADP-dependent 3-hydroxy acid dehydrogenase YdfG
MTLETSISLYSNSYNLFLTCSRIEQIGIFVYFVNLLIYIIQLCRKYMAEEKVAIITGSSTGIGYETSLALARNGFYTYATMRKLEESEQTITNISKSENLPLQVIQLDVNNDNSVMDAVNRIVEEKKRIDVVINNAGYALVGALRNFNE